MAERVAAGMGNLGFCKVVWLCAKPHSLHTSPGPPPGLPFPACTPQWSPAPQKLTSDSNGDLGALLPNAGVLRPHLTGVGARVRQPHHRHVVLGGGFGASKDRAVSVEEVPEDGAGAVGAEVRDTAQVEGAPLKGLR